MYTNPQYLRVKNLKERAGIISILAKVSALVEAKNITSDKEIMLNGNSPQLTKNGIKFLTSSLRLLFKNITIDFNCDLGIISATITPK